MTSQTTAVLIAGGGVAGLFVAIELGRRGVPCIVLEDDPGSPTFPKANATTSRSMEHYRRLGFAEEIRALGLTEDHPQDIAYFTRYATRELARVQWPSRREAERSRQQPNERWPTPEPLHRTQQMYIEGVLRRQAERWPSVQLRFGCKLLRYVVNDDGVAAEVEVLATGRQQHIRANYLVGADGPRSLVREGLGIRYEGHAGEQREFMGGKMLAVYYRSQAWREVCCGGPAWQYWAINRADRGLICAIDGIDRYVFHTQLPQGTSGGTSASDRIGVQALMRATGREFAVDLIGTAEWTAGFALVAERYGDDRQRVFILGDAAHLFTPTGGQGYNTAVDDAANLGWKLAACCQGWGGRALLASFEAERKPIGHRNTAFARAMADSIGRVPVVDALEQDSTEGDAARAALGMQLAQHCNTEFDIPGIHLGVFYGQSGVVCDDGTAAPADRWDRYLPHGTPGARAPHCWLGEDLSIHDRFGRDFTLLRLGDCTADTAALQAAAQARGVPLSLLDVPSEQAYALYGGRLLLIRPDHHIAWRGNAAPADAQAVIDRVIGWDRGPEQR